MPAKPGPLRPHEERPSYARRHYAEPPPGEPTLGDTFLIVTEGEVTERLYFESLTAELQMGQAKVQVVHPACTDAVGLVRAAMGFYERDSKGRRVAKNHASNRDIEVYDQVWVLFDTDVPARQGQLGPALELARSEDIHVGRSTPCVELWLLLHFRDRPGPLRDSIEAERAVEREWGKQYDKSHPTFRQLWPRLRPNLTVAVSRAVATRRYHADANSSFPPNPSTELDLLVRALNASVQPKMRICS
jgi:hypothetical protein